MAPALHHSKPARYWLTIFGLYAIVEAIVQLMFFVVINNFGTKRICIIEFHLVMWAFQCLFIIPIWWVAWLAYKQSILVQVLVNVAFYVVYSYFWFGPVQDAIGYVYNNLQEFTRPLNDREPAYLDDGSKYSYFNHQLLKHVFRLSWFFLAAYYFNYRRAEKKRMELAIANSELQLKLLRWHLNPSFYFRTIDHLKETAQRDPGATTQPILQLSMVMEYVIYQAKESSIDLRKELAFLENYIDLLNQQPGQRTRLILERKGDPGMSRIAPLLLAGFIDKLAETPPNGTDQRRVKLDLTGKGIELVLQGVPAQPVWLREQDAIYQRLEKLYGGKFSHSYSESRKEFSLQLSLDAAT